MTGLSDSDPKAREAIDGGDGAGAAGAVDVDDAGAAGVGAAGTVGAANAASADAIGETSETQGLEPGYAGLGVDIVEVERIRKVLARTPNFAKRVFTQEEREYCDSRAHPERHYAARFAAKEAVAKALGCGFTALGPAEIGVTLNDKGRPQAVLVGRAAQVAQGQGVKAVHISLSHTAGLAVANAVAITDACLPKRDEREDPQQRLMRAFKEARGVLDDIDARIAEKTQAPTPSLDTGDADDGGAACDATDNAADGAAGMRGGVDTDDAAVDAGSAASGADSGADSGATPLDAQPQPPEQAEARSLPHQDELDLGD